MVHELQAILPKWQKLLKVLGRESWWGVLLLCCNPSFGLATKARACWSAGQKWIPIVAFNVLRSVGECDGMNPHIPKWVFTLGIGVLMDFWIFKGRLSFGYLKHKLWPKEGLESNCQFDFWPLKVKNRLNLFACRRRATYLWKALNESYNFISDLTLIGSLNKKLWVSKVAEVSISRILGLPTWVSGDKMTFWV
jgi:hypothetical protein